MEALKSLIICSSYCGGGVEYKTRALGFSNLYSHCYTPFWRCLHFPISSCNGSLSHSPVSLTPLTQ